jgi:hypothetical protein
MPKVFSVMAQAQKTKIPPNPFVKGGELQGIALKVPLCKKGDLGGFKNQPVE